LRSRALGRKVSDEYTVPVCRLHHRELHRHGDEAAWWMTLKIDPVPIAFALWRSTHRDGAFSLAGGGKRLQAETGEDVPVKIGTRWELGLRYKLQILGAGPGPVL
jgi:hypothetical protein